MLRGHFCIAETIYAKLSPMFYIDEYCIEGTLSHGGPFSILHRQHLRQKNILGWAAALFRPQHVCRSIAGMGI